MILIMLFLYIYILLRSDSMCGIYGITDKNKNWITSYIKKCHYRGPDMSEIFCDENITLGHNLLSITDTPLQGAQPWKTVKGNILIYNGEIFNYIELLKDIKILNQKQIVTLSF